MKVTKDTLVLTNYEATALACRLRNQAQLAYIPEDPDFQPAEGEKARDLFEMAAQMIEAGGSIRAQGKVPLPAPAREKPERHKEMLSAGDVGSVESVLPPREPRVK